jgi:hypothetical protein
MTSSDFMSLFDGFQTTREPNSYYDRVQHTSTGIVVPVNLAGLDVTEQDIKVLVDKEAGRIKIQLKDKDYIVFRVNKGRYSTAGVAKTVFGGMLLVHVPFTTEYYDEI